MFKFIKGGSKVGLRLQYGPDEGAEALQRNALGQITAEHKAEDGNTWYQFRFDEVFDYQRPQKETSIPEYIRVAEVLIRSRWVGYDVSSPEGTSVFVLVIPDKRKLAASPIRFSDFYFDAWAMVRPISRSQT